MSSEDYLRVNTPVTIVEGEFDGQQGIISGVLLSIHTVEVTLNNTGYRALVNIDYVQPQH